MVSHAHTLPASAMNFKEYKGAEKQAIKMTRKAAKADAKAETAAREAESSGVLPEEDKEEK